MRDTVYKNHFITPEGYESLKREKLAGPNGWLLFAACNAGQEFAGAVKAEYERLLAGNNSELKEIPLMGTPEDPLTRVFSDTETCPRLSGHVAGSDAYVFQSAQENVTGNTVGENIQQMLQAIRTLRTHGAKTVTVVTPYSPYSRQDKPTFMRREAALASLFADQLKVAGADNYLTYHPHTLSLYGFYEPKVKFIALSGLDLFVSMFEQMKGKDETVAVSTDAGGAKFTVHFSDAMDVDYAIANKFRHGKDKSSLLGIIGHLEGKKTAVICDDETVTGSSIINACKSLHQNYGVDAVYAAVSHLKVKREYLERFREAHEKFGLKEMHFTDTIPQVPEVRELDFLKMHSLAGMFAATVNRLHYNQSISQVFSRG